MSAPARSLFIFGCYAIIAGLGLVVTPSLVLGIFQFPPTAEGWVRVTGLLAMAIGAYDVLAARHELLAYVRASVAIRLAVALGMVALVATSQMPAPLLLFAAIDALSAVWTTMTLRDSRGVISAAASS